MSNITLQVECLYCGHIWVPKWTPEWCEKCRDTNLRIKKIEKVDFYKEAIRIPLKKGLYNK